MLAALIISACMFAFYAGMRCCDSDHNVPLVPIALMCLCIVLAMSS